VSCSRIVVGGAVDPRLGQRIAHEKTIELFKTEASTGSNPKLVAFAKMTLPVIEGHLQMDESDVRAMSSK